MILGVIIVINMLLTVVSTHDEVYVPVEHSPAWAYVLIGAAALCAVVAAAFLISKKIK